MLESGGERYLLGRDAVSRYAKEFGDAKPVATLKGSELIGRSYLPLFDFLADPPKAFRVLGGDFVSAEDGTGVVHLAPAFGEDDQNACTTAGIPTVLTVDDHAKLTALVPDYEGRQVFDANKPIIADLKARGAVVRHDVYVHPYPHCWRCDTPLVYKAVSSWFVAASKLRDRMGELNQEIDWVPAHVRDGQFGKWLAGARDWSISRNWFWGSPIPV